MGELLRLDDMDECRLYSVTILLRAEFKGCERGEKGWVLVFHDQRGGLIRVPAKCYREVERLRDK